MTRHKEGKFRDEAETLRGEKGFCAGVIGIIPNNSDTIASSISSYMPSLDNIVWHRIMNS